VGVGVGVGVGLGATLAVGEGVGKGVAVGDGVRVGLVVGLGAGLSVGLGESVGDGDGRAVTARVAADRVIGAEGGEAGPRHSCSVGTTRYTTCCPGVGESWQVRKGGATVQTWMMVVVPACCRFKM
jgi:hypothetical protein